MSVEKTNRVYDQEMSFVAKDGTKMDLVASETEINIEALEAVFESILDDAKKSNRDNGAAGRRFRNNTTALGKAFIGMRVVTPVK